MIDKRKSRRRLLRIHCSYTLLHLCSQGIRKTHRRLSLLANSSKLLHRSIQGQSRSCQRYLQTPSCLHLRQR